MKRSCLLLLILLAVNISAIPRSLQQKVTTKHKASSSQVSNYPGGYLAPYVLVGGPHENFKELVCFWVTYRRKVDEQQSNRKVLIPDSNGFIPVGGRLIASGNVIYRFKDAKLREVGAVKETYLGNVLSRTYRKHPIALSFATDSVNGVSFQFDGAYLDEPEKVGAHYVTLKGKLIRFLNGRRIAEALLKFTPNITA